MQVRIDSDVTDATGKVIVRAHSVGTVERIVEAGATDHAGNPVPDAVVRFASATVQLPVISFEPAN